MSGVSRDILAEFSLEVINYSDLLWIGISFIPRFRLEPPRDNGLRSKVIAMFCKGCYTMISLFISVGLLSDDGTTSLKT